MMETLTADITALKQLSINERSPQKVLSMLKMSKMIAGYSNNEKKYEQYSKEFSGYMNLEKLPNYRMKHGLKENILTYVRLFDRNIKKKFEEQDTDKKLMVIDMINMFEMESLVNVGGKIISLRELYMEYFEGLEQDIMNFIEDVLKDMNKDAGDVAEPEFPKELAEILKNAGSNLE